MNTWYAVVCKPRCEARAEFNLVNQGYQVFLPRLAVQTRRNSKWVDKLESLFPRDLFLAITNPRRGLSRVRSTLGASDLVRVGGLPATVPHEIIEALQTEAGQATSPLANQSGAKA